jgi:hypothetical protein
MQANTAKAPAAIREQLALPKRPMHDHRQLARQGHGRSLEPEPFFQLQRPGSQSAGIRRSVQNDRSRFV